MEVMNEKEIKIEIRLLFTNSEKEEYTKAEIVELLDKIALSKEQE